ncbi:MAG: hypothetical protein NZ583_01295 [Desulfobacterota bacterium]|nr:hypothetical protein [Thermodesulfobacteriota bacterium]MDW8001350.1 hypothetical protein [Deltaproteobacteria bacterium]
MKKKTNRRALFVFITVTLIYSVLGFDVHRKMELKRTESEKFRTPTSAEILETHKSRHLSYSISDNPFSFASVLLLCAISEGKIDKDYLILVESGDNMSCKKPLEIIEHKDKEGLKSLFQLLGKTYLLRFLEKEGIEVPKNLNTEDILLGKGYFITKEKIAELYEKYASVFSAEEERHVEKKEANSSAKHWIMPDLRGYPIREAIYLINQYTTKIKVFGFGEVQDQRPLPYEKVTSETECVLWGTLNRP